MLRRDWFKSLFGIGFFVKFDTKISSYLMNKDVKSLQCGTKEDSLLITWIGDEEDFEYNLDYALSMLRKEAIKRYGRG